MNSLLIRYFEKFPMHSSEISYSISINNKKKYLTLISEVKPDSSTQTEGEGSTTTDPSDLKTLQEWEYKLKKVGKSLERCSEVGKLTSKMTLHYLSWVGDAEKLREHCVNTGSVNVNATLNYDVTPLHLAAFKKFREVIDVLMEHGAESDCVMEESDIQPLHIAASCGSVSCVRSILKSDARIDHTDKSGRTALHWAAARGYDNCVRELIKFQNGDPNVKDSLNHKPICYAFRSECKLCIRELLKNESNISCSASCLGEDGWKLLHWLVEKKHVDCLEALSERRDIMMKNIESIKDQDGFPLLIRALQVNEVSILKLLLRHKGQLEYRDEIDNSLVHIASRENVACIIPTLLLSLDVNEKNKGEMTPLHLSVGNGNLETLNVLINRPDIKVNATDSQGVTPLLVAARTPFLEVVNTLLTHKDILVNARIIHNDHCPFFLAVTRDHTEIAKALIRHPNFSVNQHYGESSETPLISATLSGNVEVIEALLQHINIQVNDKNNFGKSALHYAAESGKVEVIEALLKHKDIQVNFENNLAGYRKGWSALHYAAERGDVEIVKILLACPHTCINAKDDQGRTPLNLAITDGHIAVVNELRHNYRIRKINMDEVLVAELEKASLG